jgi:hypothetical protein
MQGRAVQKRACDAGIWRGTCIAGCKIWEEEGLGDWRFKVNDN